MPNMPSSETTTLSRQDVVLALVFVLAGLALMLYNVTDKTIHASPAAIPLFAFVTVPVLWRRVALPAAAGAALGGLVLHELVFGSLIRCGIVFALAFVVAFTAAQRARQRDQLVGVGLAGTLVVVVLLDDRAVGPVAIPAFLALTGAVFAVGLLIRGRRVLAEHLAEQTTQLRAVRDECARLEVASDRARMSAELDLLLHQRLAALARLAEDRNGPPDETLRAIEQQSRSTLEEMRGLVGALRREGDGASPTAPQPTLTHLEALLVRATGPDARLRVEGSPRVLPAGVELSAYRVVEHLLDSVQHDSAVDVCVAFHDDALKLTVSGRSRRGSTSPAIERARERVALHRGRLEATTDSGVMHTVALLPLAGGQ